MNLADFSLKIETISLPIAKKRGVTVLIARADTVHPLASGNKLYKLLPNIEYAKQHHYQQLLSFGGAFSNHIHALALYSQAVGLQSIAIIRGEKEYATNPTLSAAIQAGMKLEFVNRATYKQRYNEEYLQRLQQRYPNAFIVPEGGSNVLALQGCSELMRQININCWQQKKIIADVVTVACGTGMTFSGLVKGAMPQQNIRGYLVLKDKSVYGKVDCLVAGSRQNKNYTIEAADFGGYAKFDRGLLDFILEFLHDSNILLDPIYTSKMCKAVVKQIEMGQFATGTQLLILHSGGLQAWHGMQARVVQLAGSQAWKKIYQNL